jgi:GR25 family glycosyltransferase involved in LPS biosynthesis
MATNYILASNVYHPLYNGFFDKVVCVTLRGNVDRQAHAVRVIRDTLKIGFEFFVADRHPQGGRMGCFDSHMTVIRACYADPNCRSVLIFEDDVTLTPAYDEERVADCLAYLSSNPDGWTSLMLGYMPLDKNSVIMSMLRFAATSQKVARSTYRYPFLYFTHAYALSRRGMLELLQHAPAELAKGPAIMHLDWFIVQTLSRLNQTIMVAPMQFAQAWCFGTDNEAVDNKELLIRKLGCVEERVQLLTYFSYAPVLLPAIVAISVVLMVVAAAVVLYLHRTDNKLYRAFITRQRARLASLREWAAAGY